MIQGTPDPLKKTNPLGSCHPAFLFFNRLKIQQAEKIVEVMTRNSSHGVV
jgi:hypothetical protein